MGLNLLNGDDNIVTGHNCNILLVSMNVVTHRQQQVEIHDKCVISNKRHPLYNYYGYIIELKDNQLSKLVLKTNSEERLVASIHTNSLRHYHNQITTTPVPDDVFDRELPELWIANDITIERYCDNTIMSEDESYISSDDACNAPGKCSECGSFGPIGTYCLSDECEDSGMIYV